jgi:hypothetical protein
VLNFCWSTDNLGTFGVNKKLSIFEEYLVAFKVIMFYFELFSMIFPHATYPGPEIKSHFGVLENKAFCKFFRSFSDVYFWENTKFVRFYPVFSCAQFLVVYRYLGTFGVNKN